METPEFEKPKEDIPDSSSEKDEELDENNAPVDKYTQIIDGLTNLLAAKDATKE